MQIRHVISEGAVKLNSANFNWFPVLSDKVLAAMLYAFSILERNIPRFSNFGPFMKKRPASQQVKILSCYSKLSKSNFFLCCCVW